MKIIFAGTPPFAAVALDALHDAGHEIALVLTQPDRPAGRGRQALSSAVKRRAGELGLTMLQPLSLKDGDVATRLSALGADAMVVAAYGLIIPAGILALPRRGCINVHASLLPRWRGAAPIQRALLAGDAESGISIMQMDAGLDTGPVLLQQTVPIRADDTAQSLHDRLAVLGAQLIVRALEQPLVAHAQDESRATYASKIDKQEAHIDWNEPAQAIERKVRAFNPIPGAATCYEGAVLKIWRAALAADVAAAPGMIVRANKQGVTVACGDGGAINLLEVQRSGGKRLPVAAFLAGNPLTAGGQLGI
ncbi:MAG TPA: methionyl-tRNA formyltransferase [Burkholderiales bacterium]|jgi:methionyl-tRNA formyltransferase